MLTGREMNPIAMAGVTLPPNPQWGLTQLWIIRCTSRVRCNAVLALA
jgi:hypothetical protein